MLAKLNISVIHNFFENIFLLIVIFNKKELSPPTSTIFKESCSNLITRNRFIERSLSLPYDSSEDRKLAVPVNYYCR